MRNKNKKIEYFGYVPDETNIYGSASSNQQVQNKKKLSLSWRHLVIFICALVFITCAIMLISYAVDAAKTKNLNDLSSDIIFNTPEVNTTINENTVQPIETTNTPAPLIAKPIEQTSNSPTEPVNTSNAPNTAADLGNPWRSHYPNNSALRISSAFYELRNTYHNNDICAYLEIENVISGQPVVQKDNSFYLNHSVDKKVNQNGTLFIDEGCDLTTVPDQIVVYGHNMKDGLAFGPLKKYATKNASFFQANPFITFNTLYENGRYVIFSIIDDLDIRSGQPTYLPFWFYSDFSSVEEFNDYILKARSLSKIHCNVDIQPGDRLLVLSTCVGTNEYQKNLRFIIMARKIREGETEFELKQKILTSTDK